MSTPKLHHVLRPVQVQFMNTFVLVEHIPGRKATPRDKSAVQRIKKAEMRGDKDALLTARIDYLAEMLQGWSLSPGKPTRAALARMPEGLINAIINALRDDAIEFIKETEG